MSTTLITGCIKLIMWQHQAVSRVDKYMRNLSLFTLVGASRWVLLLWQKNKGCLFVTYLSHICCFYFIYFIKTIILLIRDMVVECCYRRFGCETIHPTQKYISMNLLQMSCVITWAWSFLTPEVVEAVRGQKRHISILWHSMFCSSHSTSSDYQRFL